MNVPERLRGENTRVLKMQFVNLTTKINVKPYEESDAPLWDEFIGRSINGTIFHRRKFLSYHPPRRFADSSLMFYTRNTLMGVFPAAIILDNGKKVLKSHPGSSFGSLVVDRPPGILDANQMVQELMKYASLQGCERIEFRMAPKIYNIYPADELDFAFRLNGFNMRDVELATCVPLEKFASQAEEDIIRTFDESCRRSTRKALSAGVEVRLTQDEADIKAFWDVLAENLKKHGAKPTHTKEELLDLKRRFPDDVELVGVFDGGRLIAGIVAFVVNRNAAHVFYFGSLYAHQEKRGLNLAVLRLIQFGLNRKLKYVNFGISTEKGGKFVNWGLFRFKESFGGHGAVRAYWVKEL
ncbi:hypothetical protein BAC2_02182 [uncultured bacterium]|nr:hypothetical protein BAC2_02182 [uncultured bacterium]